MYRLTELEIYISRPGSGGSCGSRPHIVSGAEPHDLRLHALLVFHCNVVVLLYLKCKLFFI